ncbi:chaperone modulator CbpM [Halodesulfovibrio marinisediminis]|uniref:Chaperone modulatory protein CbpM n=1 Tax=Halodesulfovibrio marinisediminis DSM 17456 TaxID=1121457 RepID=A0A1N6DTC0_9BACT|nr:chaperone modulator CbpM [Halodesulfovibrio marinisediminis]SIN74035.1 chaperone modulatory protein CbpM [Halodesulfovibrio marinisediminis DSM 17456]
MARTIIEIQAISEELPVRSDRIAWAQFLELTGIHPSRLGELLEMEWIIPAKAANKHYLFTRKDVFRVRKLIRICDDFNLTPTGGSIIVDLLERVEELERKVQELESAAE